MRGLVLGIVIDCNALIRNSARSIHEVTQMKLNELSNEQTRGGIVLISAQSCLLTNRTTCRVNVGTVWTGRLILLQLQVN